MGWISKRFYGGRWVRLHPLKLDVATFRFRADNTGIEIAARRQDEQALNLNGTEIRFHA